MKKKTKRVAITFKQIAESLRFQTMWGAKQKFADITPEIEARIDEELLVFNNLGVNPELVTLNSSLKRMSKELGITSMPSKGILAGSVVAYCLGLEPTNPYESGVELNPMDFQLPLQLTISYDNEVRNKVVDWLTEQGFNMTTYLGQPMIKNGATRVIIRRVVNQ